MNMNRPVSPPQTIGPFFHDSLMRDSFPLRPPLDRDVEQIRMKGFVVDGVGAPVNDAMIEVWHADASGAYFSDTPNGNALNTNTAGGRFLRIASGADGGFEFDTVLPGARADGSHRETPHVNLQVFARGLLDRLCTRAYLGDRILDDDSYLNGLPRDRQETLIAKVVGRTPLVTYRFDIVLQGAAETAFFRL